MKKNHQRPLNLNGSAMYIFQTFTLKNLGKFDKKNLVKTQVLNNDATIKEKSTTLCLDALHLVLLDNFTQFMQYIMYALLSPTYLCIKKMLNINIRKKLHHMYLMYLIKALKKSLYQSDALMWYICTRYLLSSFDLVIELKAFVRCFRS